MINRRDVLFMGAALASVARTVHSAEKWIEGRHYFKLEKPQPAARSAATVTEIFSYGCSACNSFLPYMEALEKKLGARGTVAYLHASWLPAENWPVLQRAHVTATALGIARKTHEAMFRAVWQAEELSAVDARTGRQKSPMPSLQDMARFYQRIAAVPAAKFLETARSFSVDSEIRRIDALINSMRADSTPTIVVNGKYRLEPRTAGGAQQAVDLTLFLAG